MPLRPVVRVVDTQNRLGALQKSRREVNSYIVGLCPDLMRIRLYGTQGKTRALGAAVGKDVDQGLGLGGECSSELSTIDAEDLSLSMYPIEGLVEGAKLIP